MAFAYHCQWCNEIITSKLQTGNFVSNPLTHSIGVSII
nr:MAG TPA: C2H2 type zinc-finger protein [Caudoviricetes sp.]